MGDGQVSQLELDVAEATWQALIAIQRSVDALATLLTNLPAPQVTVTAPPVTVPEIVLPEYPAPVVMQAPAVDLASAMAPVQEALAEIAKLLKKGPAQPALVKSGPGQLLVGNNPVSPSNPLPVEGTFVSTPVTAIVDVDNSIEASLSAGENWTGEWVDTLPWAGATILVSASSLIQGYAEYSDDGVTVITSMTTPFAGSGSFAIPFHAAFYRLRIENAGACDLLIQSVLRPVQTQGFQFPIGAPIDPSFLANLTKATITGQDILTGAFANLNVYPTGTFYSTPSMVVDDSGTPVKVLTSGSDTVSNSDNEMLMASLNYVWNGTNFVRLRGDATFGMRTDVQSRVLTKATVTASSSGNNTILTPTAGSKIRLYHLGYSAGAGVTGVLVGARFGAAGTIFDNEYLVTAGQAFARNIQAGKRYVDGAVNEPLVVNLSGAQTVYVNIEYEEI